MTVWRDRYLKTIFIVTVLIILVMSVVRQRLTTTYSPWVSHTPVEHSQPAQQPPPEKLGALPSRGPFRVTRVIDGDTLILNNGETVRLIGVDAPETHHPEIPVQRFGKEATEFLRRLAEGFECTLEYEPGELRDAYGRLLAYVFVGDRLVNAELIRRGYAYAYTRFPFRRQAEFMALEREARERQYGLWSLSLRDGRIANLVKRYESLNLEGRRKLDELLGELVRKYPYGQEDKTKKEKP